VAELRMVSVMGLSSSDLLHYTSDARLGQELDRGRALLDKAGLSEAALAANLRSFGPDLKSWKGLRGRPEALRSALGGSLHALQLHYCGPWRDYESAVQGADVLDTGIPHRELLKLLEDPAPTCWTREFRTGSF
jgi:hypothetical protein